MAATGTDERVPTYCALCISRCGATAVVRDGALVSLEPDPSHPTGQALCVKGKAAPELVYHRERLRTPLRRTRPKTDPDPGWQPISWDEALDITARRLLQLAREHGPESVVFTAASPSTSAMSRLGGLAAAAASGVRQPEPVRVDGAVRMGPVLCDQLHVRGRRPRCLPAGPRERRLHSVLGIQPDRRPAQPRHGDGRRAASWRRV